MRPVSEASGKRRLSCPSYRVTFVIICTLAVLFVCGTTMFSTAMITQSTKTAVRTNSKNSVKNIFCFGDSLTAGTTRPSSALYPYAKDLEEAINRSGKTSVVRWKGYPGWTSSQLFTGGGLSGFLDTAAAKFHPVDLVIILAGTNDMAYTDDSEEIFQSIQKIHDLAHSKGCQTVALSIPPSGYQSHVDSARLLANDINEKLKAWASTSTHTSFVPYPVATFDQDSGLWASDGLHLSPEGYKTVGESLAPVITKILWGEP